MLLGLQTDYNQKPEPKPVPLHSYANNCLYYKVIITLISTSQSIIGSHLETVATVQPKLHIAFLERVGLEENNCGRWTWAVFMFYCLSILENIYKKIIHLSPSTEQINIGWKCLFCGCTDLTDQHNVSRMTLKIWSTELFIWMWMKRNTLIIFLWLHFPKL